MAIIVNQITTSLDEPKDAAIKKAASFLGLSESEIKCGKVHKSSIDARHGISFVNSVYFEFGKAFQR